MSVVLLVGLSDTRQHASHLEPHPLVSGTSRPSSASHQAHFQE